VYARKLLTQRRKAAKRCRASRAFFGFLCVGFLCVFAPLRETNFLAFRPARQFEYFSGKHVEPILRGLPFLPSGVHNCTTLKPQQETGFRSGCRNTDYLDG